MEQQKELSRWIAEAGSRAIELRLALTGNPRERVAVPVDTLAILVLLAKRSQAWLDYNHAFKVETDRIVDECLCLCDERAHELIENHCADYEAHLEAFKRAGERDALSSAQHS